MNKYKERIINWLEGYKIKNYTLIPDPTHGFVVDVDGDVDLSRKRLIEIPIKFNIVRGSFRIHLNELTTLSGSPSSVESLFECSGNQLTSLLGGPEHVGGSYFCGENQLSDFRGSPKSVGRGFYCNNNPQLGEYQKIRDFKEVEEILAIQKEKDLLQSNVKEGGLSNLHKI